MGARIVFIGDDFTGASDSLATYERAGMSTRMVLGDAGNDGLEALGLPTDLRSLAPERARDEIASLWPRVAAEAPEVIHFKVCSTFDSAPEVGSIGAVTQELIDRFSPDVVAVIGGQPSLGRHCAFGTLFARGPDGETHRIDRHPIMSRHPVTPMREADLRRHLAAQGLTGLDLISISDLRDPASAARTLRTRPALIDATHPDDLTRITEVLRLAGGRQLLVGASSVAEILGAGTDRAASAHLPLPASNNLLLFAGSRSQTTSAQVAEAKSYTRLPLTPEALRSGALIAQAQRLLSTGTPTLVHLLPDADYGLSPDGLADRCAAFVATLLEGTEIGYLGLAGGDTSSRICAQLGFEALAFEHGLAPGVCICLASHPSPRRDHMRIMLKGGQMGERDLFDRFAATRRDNGPVHGRT
ncbi:four-carbon acid sugar kinase family protein [Salipiger bermudensis]|uniref:four-carbon acid sugar kinase family protein n=1 Tax=Salipiger bermudensis TaxID=344736 RepID=UPI001CD1E188|nr:four-carbon acid sugar kinase family protein [Salipiger bermudensis]MCA0961984.1 four-carbon acid sugar kinase family protein [Salipiger bermudensis]